jgi:ketosteroid isomerase-like protein
MGQEELIRTVQELADREAIRQCVATYCRAVDRMDRELLLTVYHPDAVDDHGLFLADREDFADQAFAFHRERQYGHQHVITNHTCELDGDVAHAETYWMLAAMNKTGSPLSLSGGRYIDRFEKRDGRWAIAARLCVSDWHGQPGPSAVPPELRAILNAGGTPARDRSDPSYMRPLKVRTPEKASG